jgi:predicted RNase H-like HicB family nuclease
MGLFNGGSFILLTRVYVTMMESVAAPSSKIVGVFIKVDDGYIAYLEDDPSAITEGRTLEEAQANLVDAYKQLQIARHKRQDRKAAAEKEIAEFECELESSSHEVKRIPVEIPA